MKYLDIPPFWLIAALSLAWILGQFFDSGFSLDFPMVQMLGGMLVGGGIILIALATIEFFKHKTTIIPHKTAERLITQGIFKRSRNPLYVGDALILLGLILRWDSVLSLSLLPIFVWVIEKRFILPEEDRLRRKFRVEFARYLTQTRRWI